MKEQSEYIIDAVYDEHASVYVFTSQDIPGLMLEAASIDVAHDAIINLAPTLLNITKKALYRSGNPFRYEIVDDATWQDEDHHHTTNAARTRQKPPEKIAQYV